MSIALSPRSTHEIKEGLFFRLDCISPLWQKVKDTFVGFLSHTIAVLNWFAYPSYYYSIYDKRSRIYPYQEPCLACDILQYFCGERQANNKIRAQAILIKLLGINCIFPLDVLRVLFLERINEILQAPVPIHALMHDTPILLWLGVCTILFLDIARMLEKTGQHLSMRAWNETMQPLAVAEQN